MTKTNRRTAARRAAEPSTKFERIIAMLTRPEGASVAQLAQMTGWKINSVRGVLAGALKHRYGLTISSEKPDKVRIYRAAGPQ